jgi:hypothetical protein
MMGSRLRRRLSWAVGALAVALTGALVAEASPGEGTGIAQPEARSAPLPSTAAAEPDAPPVDDWAAVTLARPLFALDRRPEETTALPEEALPRLSGTIHLADTALAMFEPEAGSGSTKTLVLGDGAELAGWTITDITNGGVTLVRDGRIATLRLSYANLPAQPRRLGLVPTRVLHNKRTSVFFQP